MQLHRQASATTMSVTDGLHEDQSPMAKQLPSPVPTPTATRVIESGPLSCTVHIGRPIVPFQLHPLLWPTMLAICCSPVASSLIIKCVMMELHTPQLTNAFAAVLLAEWCSATQVQPTLQQEEEF
jgi:hypothetical protein